MVGQGTMFFFVRFSPARLRDRASSGCGGEFTQPIIHLDVLPVFEAGYVGHLALQDLDGGALGVLHAAALDDASLQMKAKDFRITKQRSAKVIASGCVSSHPTREATWVRVWYHAT